MQKEWPHESFKRHSGTVWHLQAFADQDFIWDLYRKREFLGRWRVYDRGLLVLGHNGLRRTRRPNSSSPQLPSRPRVFQGPRLDSGIIPEPLSDLGAVTHQGLRRGVFNCKTAVSFFWWSSAVFANSFFESAVVPMAS